MIDVRTVTGAEAFRQLKVLEAISSQEISSVHYLIFFFLCRYKMLHDYQSNSATSCVFVFIYKITNYCLIKNIVEECFVGLRGSYVLP